MHKILLASALLIPAATAGIAQSTTATSGQNSNAEQAALKVTQEWLAADERHDRATLNRIIADDFQGTGPTGRTVSKGDIIPRAEADTRGLAISAQDMKVRVFGDTAIISGRGLPKIKAEEGSELRFTVVLVRRKGDWQMVGAHLSTVPRE